MRVFGRSPQGATLGEVAGFVRDGGYFDEEPTFDPADALERMADAGWAALEIRYEPAPPPVVVWRSEEGGAVASEVDEALARLAGAGEGSNAAALRARLRAATVVFGLEVSADTVSDEVWAMLDALAGYVARRSDGVVYAPDDGFFDADLQLLVRCR
ncbi:MAG: hypothetical protein ACRD12_07890 [Acidimicrobiales bacterium]